MRVNHELVELLNKFGVVPTQIETIKRGVYRVTAPKDELYCLKRMSMPTEQLTWIDSVLLTLRRQGFRSAAWRDPSSRYGKIPYVRRSPHSSPYILTPWLSGSIPAPKSTQDLYACAQTLAKFHRAGQSVKVPQKGSANWLGLWPRLLKSRIELMEHKIKYAQSLKVTSRFETLLHEHGSWLMERAQQALSLIDNKEYQRLCRAAKSTNATLCHADSGPKNFVLTGDGPALIDFESMRYDLRIYDLYRLIRLASKKNGWNAAIVHTVMNGYRSASDSDLTPIEYDLLKAWLLFPQKAYRAISRYDKSNTFAHRHLESKLTKGIDREKSITEFVQHFTEFRGME